MNRYAYQDRDTGTFALWYPRMKTWHIGRAHDKTIYYDRWLDDYTAKTHYKIDGIVTAKRIVQAKIKQET
jgi:hypothetical protein